MDRQKLGWRVRLVNWLADLLGVETYPAPWAILIYSGLAAENLAALHKQVRAEDEAVH